MLYHLLFPLHTRFHALNVLRYVSTRIILATLTALLLSFLLGPWFIERLRSKQIGEQIRSDGPQTHKKKAGTPTMGGSLILFALAIPTLLWCDLTNQFVWLALAVTIGYGVIGFADDYLKLTRSKAGLPGRLKLLGQFAIAIAAVAYIYGSDLYDPELRYRLSLPLVAFDRHPIALWPWLYGAFAVIVIVGSSNAVNITDGLDGLAIGPTIIAAGTFLILAYGGGQVISGFNIAEYLKIPFIHGSGELAVFCGAMLGAGIGFLWYNTYPAAVFMGDVGRARARRRARHARRAHQERVHAAHPRRGVRRRDPVGDGAGHFLQAHRQARLQDGAAAPPLRAQGLGGAEGHRALLDHRLHAGDDRACDPEGPVSVAEVQRPTVVVGAGKTGVAVARFLAARGEAVLLSDQRAEAELSDARAGLGDSVQWETGGHRAETFAGAARIVLSPGVPRLPALEAARAAKVPITGEIELAASYIEAPIVGITGTNGKSTVTALCGAIAQASGRPAFVGGNLGTPLIEAVGTPAASSQGICVVELSSYQLETVERMHPRAAAFLNLSADHLDRYGSMDAYAAAKMNIARRMDAGDVLVLNGDDVQVLDAFDRWCAERPGQPAPQPYLFVEDKTPGGSRIAYVSGEDFVLRLDAGEERYARSLCQLIGKHNEKNVLAALLLMRASGLATPEAVRTGLAGFRALPHRMELVVDRGGVRYYDDSKATNVDSVVAGIDGFPVPFVLIAGGRDKGGSYAPLVEALRRSTCRGVVTIGEAAPLIEEALLRQRVRHVRAGSLPAAIAQARGWVASGEAVVLSPACSSFDMFQDYAHRGQVFRDAAEAQA